MTKWQCWVKKCLGRQATFSFFFSWCDLISTWRRNRSCHYHFLIFLRSHHLPLSPKWSPGWLASLGSLSRLGQCRPSWHLLPPHPLVRCCCQVLPSSQVRSNVTIILCNHQQHQSQNYSVCCWWRFSCSSTTGRLARILFAAGFAGWFPRIWNWSRIRRFEDSKEKFSQTDTFQASSKGRSRHSSKSKSVSSSTNFYRFQTIFFSLEPFINYEPWNGEIARFSTSHLEFPQSWLVLRRWTSRCRIWFLTSSGYKQCDAKDDVFGSWFLPVFQGKDGWQCCFE